MGSLRLASLIPSLAPMIFLGDVGGVLSGDYSVAIEIRCEINKARTGGEVQGRDAV